MKAKVTESAAVATKKNIKNTNISQDMRLLKGRVWRVLQISYVPQPMNRLVQRVIAATSLHEFCGRWDGLDVESVVSGDNLLCRHGKFVETQRWWGLHVWMLLTREMDLPYSEAADLCQTNVLPMSRSKLEESIRGLILSAVAQHYWARMHLHHNGKHQGTFRL